MVTKSAFERRLTEIEAKTKPKTIETLADWVLWLANRREGEESPPVSPIMQDMFDKLAKSDEVKNHG